MVDTYGRWTEEEDYSKYPKEKWCDYDEMCVWIKNQNYTPKTTMENLISNIFAHFDLEIEDTPGLFFSIENCQEYIESSGGLAEFDYEA